MTPIPRLGGTIGTGDDDATRRPIGRGDGTRHRRIYGRASSLLHRNGTSSGHRIRREEHENVQRRRPENGDTLIEVLVAVVVIGIGAVALLGGFATALFGSAEHRSLASIDTMLKSFAETAEFQIQQQPSPKFTDCATDYTLASGAGGTAVTVFGTGFTPGNTMSVTLTDTTTQVATSLPAADINGGLPVIVPATAPSTGDVTVTFTVPTSGLTIGDAYLITLSDGVTPGSISASSTTPFTVTTGTPVTTSALAGYSLAITSVQTWDPETSPPAFVPSPCAPSGMQLVSLSATAPNKTSDTLSVVVTNPAFVVQAFTPTVSVSPAPSGALAASTLTFTATVAGPNNAITPTGSLTWTVTGPGSPTCSNATPPNSNATPLTAGSPSNTATATCTVTNSEIGTYNATAAYPGDKNYVANSGSGTLAVQGLPSSVNITPPTPTPPAVALNVGQSMTFTATVEGQPGNPTPGGTLTWVISPPSGPTPTCSNATPPNSNATPLTAGSPSYTATATCTIPNVLAGKYTVNATYTGDDNYLAESGSGSVTVNPTAPQIPVTPTPSNPTLGSTVTFTATVTGPAGGPTPVGAPGLAPWTLTGPGTPTCSNANPTKLTPGTPTNTATATCAVSKVVAGTYQATANFGGDANYSATTGVGKITISKATPTVSVAESPSSPTPGSSITFTATIAGPSGASAPTLSLTTWALTGPSSPTCSNANPLTVTAGASNSSTATCTITNVAVGTYSVTPNYGGDTNYLAQTGSGSVVVADPPMTVTGVASTHSGTPGKLGIGDTFSVTFSEPINPSSLNLNAGATTITLCDDTGSPTRCTSNGQTNIVISGLSVPTGFTVQSSYEAAHNTTTASGTLSLSANNETVTFTDTTTPTGGSLGTGSAVTFTFIPNSNIKDTYGTAASGSYLTPTAIQLF